MVTRLTYISLPITRMTHFTLNNATITLGAQVRYPLMRPIMPTNDTHDANVSPKPQGFTDLCGLEHPSSLSSPLPLCFLLTSDHSAHHPTLPPHQNTSHICLLSGPIVCLCFEVSNIPEIYEHHSQCAFHRRTFCVDALTYLATPSRSSCHMNACSVYGSS